MKALILALLLPISALTQSIGGISIHDPQDALQQRYPVAQVSPIQDGRGLSLMSTGQGSYVMFCDGMVSEVQETVGHSVHDFASEVSAAHDRYGDATEMRAVHNDNRRGEVSWVDARWEISATLTYRVVMSQIGDTNAEVTRSFFDPTLCS